MLDDEAKRKLFQQINEFWIQPELRRRFELTGIPDGFKVREALIKLPTDREPIVEFNDEIQWELEFKVPSDVEVKEGQIVYLHEVENVLRAAPPLVDGKRVAFVFLYWSGFSYRILFDFSPNDTIEEVPQEFRLGVVVAELVRGKMIEKTVRLSKEVVDELQKIGLWIATPLVPYPMSRIVERIQSDDPDQARAILVSYCNPDFLEQKLISTWQAIEVFRARQTAFNQALAAHKHGLYHASITVLINHIEGVIVDWLYSVVPPLEVKWKTASRVARFRATLEEIPQLEYAYRVALESTLEFLREGEDAPKPFQAFSNWLGKIDPSFPSRHAISHGKYVQEMYTEENSVKLFLLLDSICQFMMFYEVRKLGKDLG